MRVDDFDYELPEELIAQTPLEDRSRSRLLVVDRKTGVTEHLRFDDIKNLLGPNDVLVLNDTKVLPSRIMGRKEGTGAEIEFLLLRDFGVYYEVLTRPARRLKAGTVVRFGDFFTAEILERLDGGICHVRFHYEGDFISLLEKAGKVPLPPYIHRELKDGNRYQTVYAKNYGSSAAPTAGLHFTEELLAILKERGVGICFVTLHIGLGTFRPVMTEEVEEHRMHREIFSMSAAAAETLNKAKREGKRIVAVGTTSVRTLETIYKAYGKFRETTGETDLFIYPGYVFKAVDALITNFHLPKSTLIMLVSAFCSRRIIADSYAEAIKRKYRFFSFGDAMFLK